MNYDELPHDPELLAKLADIDKRLADFEAERSLLGDEQNAIQTELTQIKCGIRGRWVPNYRQLCERQGQLIERLNSLASELRQNRAVKVSLHNQRESVKRTLDQQKLKASSQTTAATQLLPPTTDLLVAGLLALHSKYEGFAKDATRINSMRLLAAEVASDIHALIRKGAAQ